MRASFIHKEEKVKSVGGGTQSRGNDLLTILHVLRVLKARPSWTREFIPEAMRVCVGKRGILLPSDDDFIFSLLATKKTAYSSSVS